MINFAESTLFNSRSSNKSNLSKSMKSTKIKEITLKQKQQKFQYTIDCVLRFREKSTINSLENKK